MRYFRISLILMTASVLLGLEKNVKFYRSEQDFRRGVEISERELGRKAYLEVHYGDRGNVLSKLSFKRKNKLVQFEDFAYDSVSQALMVKSVYDADSTLLRQFLFGSGEPMSEKYIRYVYGVKKIGEFQDRFTGIEYAHGRRPTVYRFFDVDGFLYGIMNLSYDSNDRLRQEDWVAMPGERLMRRYLYSYHQDSGTTEIWEYDSTLTVVMHMTVGADGHARLLSVSFPTDSSSVNTAAVSYSLLDRLTEGKVIWEWAGGKPDGSVPHVAVFAGEDMTRGEHESVLLRNAPELVDSAFYNIRFTGRGELGFPSTEIVVQQVQFDTTPPVYSVSSRTSVNKPEMSFVLEEPLSSAEAIWVWERGERDPRAPHRVGLSAGFLTSGDHEEISFEEEAELNDGTVYTLQFGGKDAAGNLGPVILVPGIRFDSIPPELRWVKPDTGARISSSGVSYTFSEELAEGQLTWRQVSGTADTLSPHELPLSGTELRKGKHQYVLLRNAPKLVDGAVYELVIHGVDLAGNPSDTVTILNVTADLTPPVVGVHLPQAGKPAKSSEMIYSLSEDFAAARIEWQEIGEDSLLPAPHVIFLDSTLLGWGDHRLVDPDLSQAVQDGHSYRITLTGRDLAGNEAVPVEISDVLVDASPPVFANLYPVDSAYVSSDTLSYTLTESLTEGTIIWTQVGGKLDPGSPHIGILNTLEKKEGEHKQIVLSESPALQDGSIYDVSLMGIDRAGNRSEKAVINRLVFDTTPPEIDFVYPSSRSVVPTTEVSYGLSESLKEGTFTWKWIEGNRDTLAPHVVELTGKELEPGHHERITLIHAPGLVEGGIYSIVARATDFSGKTTSSEAISGVRFDPLPPDIAIDALSERSSVNSPNIRFTLSESLAEGKIVWTRTGGKDDTYSPHVVKLLGNELAAGERGDSALVNSPTLTSGAVYAVTMFGQDSAGNVSDTIMVSDIEFDRTPPAFDVSIPVAYTATSTMGVAYTLSESLSEGSVTWRWTGGAADEVGTHIQPISGTELAEGEHPQSTLSSGVGEPVEGGTYTVIFDGKDLAGNEAVSVRIPGVLHDATAPAFSEIQPSSGAHVNSTHLTYSLREPIERGRVVWVQTGGKEDPNSPYDVELVGNELNGGLHENVLLTDGPALQDSALYDISFVGTDGAGNTSDTAVVKNILYDVTSPQIEVAFPGNNANVSSTRVGYSLSEELSGASITWERTGGSEDPDSPHIRSLTGDDLLPGDHVEVQLEEAPLLKGGVSYTVTFSGRDRAGNPADPVVVSEVGFDVTKPQFTDVFPSSGMFVNHGEVSYTLTERLESGTVRWTRTGGVEDPGSPHLAQLRGDELNSGQHPRIRLIESPSLTDGTLYSLDFFGTDPGGNASDSLRVDSVGYDITAPQFTVSLPTVNSFISSAAVSYSLGEDLSEGTITWERTGGGIDEASPHEIPLQGPELIQGQHIEVLLETFPELQDGVTYTLTFAGKDRAENVSSPMSLQGVTYDGTPPLITDIRPADSTFVNHSRVSYTLSETFADGQIIWTQISGTEDPNSSHFVELVSSEMTQGQHQDVLLSNEPALQNGSVYHLSFVGRDRAGNESDTVTVPEVKYDVVPPTVRVDYPNENTFVSSGYLKYHLSEDLARGTVTWRWADGAPDPGAPHERALTDSQLLEGDREESSADWPPLVDGGVYSIAFTGVDRAGNEAEPVVVSQVAYDATPPVIALKYPEAGSHVNDASLSYSLSENMEAGEIIWTQMSGNPDPSSPHRVHLSGDELTAGDHADILPGDAPSLQDGSTYRLTFAGVDLAGNKSDTVEVSNLSFDITPPTVALEGPETNTSVNSAVVSYVLSEPLKEGTVSWQWASGSPDGQSPHTANLSGAELDSGEHRSEPPVLVDGATYTISLAGIDSAGNASAPASVQGVIYDVTPPEIVIQSPADTSHRNHSRVSFTLSESLQQGRVVWTRTGGSTDEASPHELELTGVELNAGDHVDIGAVDLRDGAVYDVEFTGLDPAGNAADTVLVGHISYDLSPPTYLLFEPENGSYVNSSSVSYHLSEQLKDATVTWERTGGTEDSGSPHQVALPGEDLFAGNDTTTLPLDLVNGAIYSVTLQGIDLAGNGGESVTITDVTYDDVDPVVTVTHPVGQVPTNSDLISYRLSEALSGGVVTWSHTGGTPDPAAPHEAELSGEELLEGDHTDVQLTERPLLQDGASYSTTFEGIDLAGNRAETVVLSGVTYDTTAPLISFTSPPGDTAVNSMELTFELSENLDSATVTWERVGGKEDPASPHASHLTGVELSSGLHERILLTEIPELVDGAVYSIAVEGVDLAGNRAEPVVVQNIMFDVSPPVIVANYPPPSSNVNSTRVSYSLTEDLASGSVTWATTDGIPDPGSPHVQPLSPSEMISGDHQDIVLTSPPKLVSGAVYSLTFDGSDRAGNRASGMIIESVTFDSVRPVFVLRIPDDKKQINEPRITYSLSETLAEGKVIWSRETGSEDPSAPHVIELAGTELDAGDHAATVTTNAPMLQDGSVYGISLTGIDPAGNQGDTVTVSSVMYDVTPPVFTLDFPQSDSFTNSLELTYSASEAMGEGTVEWTQTGGIDDASSPHAIALAVEELVEGAHESVILTNQTDLTDGAVYSLTLSGRDLASNEAEQVTADRITYDISPPRFTEIVPTSGSTVNSLEISYTLSETLSVGTLTLTQIGGSEDPNSPHVVDMSGEELFRGGHEQVVLSGAPELVSGSSYSVRFSGTDRAGNMVDTLAIEGLIYDDVSPVITAISPDTSAHVNHSRVSYRLSETLSSGTISWVPDDGGSPQVQSLSGDELGGGLHESIELAETPELEDGKVYDIRFEGTDPAGNEADLVMITDVAYDVTVPKIKVTLDSPSPQTFTKDTPVTVNNSENMLEITFSWERESGAEDPDSPYIFSLPEENLGEGDHKDIILPGSEALLPGTVYMLTVRGRDFAGNEVKPLTVESIDIIRDLAGTWLSKTALLTAVWSFRGEDDFLQGVMMGTRISQEEPGRVSIDFSKRPFEMRIEFDSGIRRYAIFEFTGRNTIRIVISERRPKSWSDGDLMEFEFSEPEVP